MSGQVPSESDALLLQQEPLLQAAIQYAILQVIDGSVVTTTPHHANVNSLPDHQSAQQQQERRKDAILSLTQLTYQYVTQIMSPDLYAFSQHKTPNPRRKNDPTTIIATTTTNHNNNAITEQDVLLLIRRSPRHIRNKVQQTVEEYCSNTATASTRRNATTNTRCTAVTTMITTNNTAKNTTRILTKSKPRKTLPRSKSVPITISTAKTTTTATVARKRPYSNSNLNKDDNSSSDSSHSHLESMIHRRKNTLKQLKSNKDDISISSDDSNSRHSQSSSSSSSLDLPTTSIPQYPSTTTTTGTSTTMIQPMKTSTNKPDNENVVHLSGTDDDEDDEYAEMDHILSVLNIPQPPQLQIQDRTVQQQQPLQKTIRLTSAKKKPVYSKPTASSLTNKNITTSTATHKSTKFVTTTVSHSKRFTLQAPPVANDVLSDSDNDDNNNNKDNIENQRPTTLCKGMTSYKSTATSNSNTNDTTTNTKRIKTKSKTTHSSKTSMTQQYIANLSQDSLPSDC